MAPPTVWLLVLICTDKLALLVIVGQSKVCTLLGAIADWLPGKHSDHSLLSIFLSLLRSGPQLPKE